MLETDRLNGWFEWIDFGFVGELVTGYPTVDLGSTASIDVVTPRSRP